MVLPKNKWRNSFRVIGLIVVIWIPFWSQIGGKQIFDYRCNTFGGLKVYNSVEAEGYFNSRYKPKGTKSLYSDRYFLQSLKDLIEGRVMFFESRYPNRTSYHRFMLKDKTDTEAVCHWYENITGLKKALSSLGLPSNKCLSVVNFSDEESGLLSKYEIATTANHHTSSASTFVKDRTTGEILGEYRSYILFNPWNFVSGKEKCPRPIDSNEILTITERVFSKHIQLH